MANKRLLVAILVLSLVTFFATPFTAFAGADSGTSIHVKQTSVPIVEIVMAYESGAPLYFEQYPGETSGANWTCSDYKEHVLEGLEEMTVTFDDPTYGEFDIVYVYPDDFGPQGGPKDAVEHSTDANGSINIWINEITVPEVEEPELTITKSVRLSGTQDLFVDSLEVDSDTVVVEYEFYVENTGDVAIDDVSVYDETLDWQSGTVDLAVDGFETFTTIVSISAADWVNGEFVNVATASGTYDAETVTSDEDDATVEYVEESTSEASISIEKTVLDGDSWEENTTVSSTSASVAFKLVVANDGDFDLTGVVIEDDALDLYIEVGNLAAAADYTTEVAFDLDDLDAAWWIDGVFTNVATASAVYGNDDYSDEDDATVTYDEPIVMEPGILLEKTVDKTQVTSRSADVVYTFEVTNNGDYTLTDVYISDEELDELFYFYTYGDLLPGETFSTTFAFNLGDLGSGEIADWDGDVFTNWATAWGYGDFTGAPIHDSDDATVTYNDPAVLTPDIQLEKSVDKTRVTSRSTDVVYTFEVTNNGDYTLYGVNVYDEDLDVTFDFDNYGALEPGQTFTTTYAFDLEDLGTGDISDWDGDVFTNWATAYGYGRFQQEGVSDRDDATVTYRRSSGGSTTSRTPTIEVIPEPTPAAPAPVVEVVLDEPVPAAPMPQTGGFDPLFLYGLGALLASGGAAMKRRGK